MSVAGVLTTAALTSAIAGHGFDVLPNTARSTAVVRDGGSVPDRW